MKFKKCFLASLLTLTIFGEFQAQDLFSDGSSIFLETQAMLFIDGSFENSQSGTVDNAGTIELKQNFINNAGNLCFTGSGQGTVLLSGANQQLSGTNTTHFHNLTLSGTGIKSITIDEELDGVLSLGSLEFSTGIFNLSVLNSSITAITQTGGFISSDPGGKVSWSTASLNPYIFPVGSSAGTPRIRPVEITPNASSPHVFSVRFANADPTSENYNRSNHDNMLCSIHDAWFHQINRVSGSSPANIKINFDATDGPFDALAHWQNIPQWENMSGAVFTNNPSPTLSFVVVNGWNDFSYTPFALGNLAPSIFLSANDSSICAGDTLTLVATNGFSNYIFQRNGSQVQSGPGNTALVSGLNDNDILTVVGDSGTCTSTSSAINVIVYANPVSAFTSSVLLGTVTFTDNSSGNPVSWAWDFGDGGTSAIQNPSHTYSAIGNYTVCLTVTNANGCTHQFCSTVNISQVTSTTGDLKDFRMEVFPNPFQNEVLLEYTMPSSGFLSLYVFDATGKLFMEKQISRATAGKVALDFSDFASGIYQLKVIGEGGTKWFRLCKQD